MKPAKNVHRVIVDPDVVPYPDRIEISAAIILANHFRCSVKFIARSHIKTADIMIGNIAWEIKSPTGSGKRTIQHQFIRAIKQSKNIVIDARRSKMDMNKIYNEVKYRFTITKSIKRVILIKKSMNVIEFKR